MIGNSVGNSGVFGGFSDAGFANGGFVDGGFGNGGFVDGGFVDGGFGNGGFGNGGFVDGGFGHYCPPGTTPVYSGGGGGFGLFGGSFLGTAAVIGGTIAIGAVIADELDDDDPVFIPVSP